MASAGAVVLGAVATLGAVAVVSPGAAVERGDPVDKPAPPPPPPEEPEETSLDTPRPSRWLPPRERCGARPGPCGGPRRVPRPHGEAARRAERLGLGTRRTANRLLTSGPRPSWTDAAQGMARQTLLWPVERGHLGRGFGYVRRSRPGLPHDGVDIPGTPGTPVRAVNDGIVAYSDNGVRGYGNTVLIVHPDGTTSLYAHLRAAYLFAGQRVRRGQVIGELGSTGISRGPHLHFEWRRRGLPRDPAPLFARANDGATS